MKVFNHILEVRLSSLQPWSHMRLHKRPYWNHLVWGRLSVVYGQPHLEPITVCAACMEEIQRVGEEYLDWCEGCQSVEGDTLEVTTEEYEKYHG